MSKRRVYMSNKITPTVFYRTLKVEGLEIFYREAGPRDAPTVLLLHGFPSSSHMFRNLIPMLADKYHVVAPDFLGYGESSAPSVNDFDYSFERLATVTEKFTEKLNLPSYALYLSDIGSSVGFRLAVMHPERVTAMIVQNGGAHVEALNKEFAKGLFDYWEDRSEKNAQVLLDWLLTIEGTKWHYLHGVSDPSKISVSSMVCSLSGGSSESPVSRSLTAASSHSSGLSARRFVFVSVVRMRRTFSSTCSRYSSS